MDVLPDEEEALIQQTASEFLAGESPPSLARMAEKDPLRYSPDLWRKMAELGWLGLCLPEEYGGQGLPLTYLELLFEEVGRHVAPVPLHSVMVPALILAQYGSRDQKELLTRVVGGDLLLTYAVQEPDGRWSPGSTQMSGRRKGEHIVLSGAKSFVDNFRIAEKCLVLFRDVATQGSGLSLALVDTASSGIDAVDLVTTAKDGQCAVTFTDVHVPVSNVVGEWGQARIAALELFDYAAVFLAAQMAGAARKATEMAVEYAKYRHAFGQPIGAFQAIQHLCADMIIATDGVQLLAREAVWKMSRGIPAGVEVSQAKAFANEKCLMACRSAQQIHGGIGFMMEFDLHLWYRRVAAWSLRGGTVSEHRNRIAAALLDRPGTVRLDALRSPEPAGEAA